GSVLVGAWAAAPGRVAVLSVSTGRHHGFESLEEARLLLALDFAGDLVDVLGQPVRLRYFTREGPREHVPDFLAFTRGERWLIDVTGQPSDADPNERHSEGENVTEVSRVTRLGLGWDEYGGGSQRHPHDDFQRPRRGFA